MTPISPRSKKITGAPNTLGYEHDKNHERKENLPLYANNITPNSPASVLPTNLERSPRRIARAQTSGPGNSTSDNGRWLFGDQNPSSKTQVTLQTPNNDGDATKQFGNHTQKHQQENVEHVNIQTLSKHNTVLHNLDANRQLQAQNAAGSGNQIKNIHFSSESKNDGLKPENIGSSEPTNKMFDPNINFSKNPLGEDSSSNAQAASRLENRSPRNFENIPSSVNSKQSRPLRPYNQNAAPGLNHHHRPGAVGTSARTPLVQGKFVPNPGILLRAPTKDLTGGEAMPPQKRVRGDE